MIRHFHSRYATRLCHESPCRTFILFAVQALLGAAAAIQFLVRAGPDNGLGHRRQPAPAACSATPSSSVGPAGLSLGEAATGTSTACREAPEQQHLAATWGPSCRDGPGQQHQATAWGSSSRREFSTLEKLFSTLFVTVLCNELAIMVLYCGYQLPPFSTE